MSRRSQTLLWIAQRASAALLAICVLVHVATVVYAVRGGLSAAEILGRTRGNGAWFAFYAIFVLAIVVHTPIGLRTVAIEWLGWRARPAGIGAVVFAAALAWLGMRAVLGVFG